MKGLIPFLLILCYTAAASAHHSPFNNTVYLEPDVITADDPNAFRQIHLVGQATAEEYSHDCDENYAGDRFYLFNATYTRGQVVEFFIDNRFGHPRRARDIAQIYAPILGQIPYVLRRGVDVVIIRSKHENWCATTGQIEIEHAGYREELADGALEESMLHETVHASLDDDHAGSAGWLNAQRRDAGFISDYAEDAPDDEDLAESFTAYYGALRGRLSVTDALELEEAIPARLAYLQKHFPISALAIE